MPIPMPTRSEFMRFAPKAKREYVDSFLALESTLEKAGILHHPLTLCHFLAQCWAETGGFTIVRENMKYGSVERIKQVWPARSRKSSEAVLASLVGDPRALSEWAYGGRMGNRKGTSDAYDFRGAGPMQTTGRYAVQKYCKACDIPFTQDVLDDAKTGWLFAIHEWVSTSCNSYALENNILAISKIINTGSATSGVMPNGLNHRKTGLKRAWAIWGDPKRQTIAEVSDLTKEALKKAGSETLKSSDLVKTGAIAGGVASGAAGAASESGTVVTVPNVSTQQTVEQANDALRTTTESVTLGTDFVTAIKSFWLLLSTNLWAVGLVLACVGYYVARKIDWRRLIDARLGYQTHRMDQVDPVDDDLPDDPELAVIPRG